MSKKSVKYMGFESFYLYKHQRFWDISNRNGSIMSIPPNISCDVRCSFIFELGEFFNMLAGRLIQMPRQNSNKRFRLYVIVRRHRFIYCSSKSKMVILGDNTSSVGSFQFHSNMPLVVTGAFEEAKLWYACYENDLRLTCIAAFEGTNCSNFSAVAFHPHAPFMATAAVGDTPTTILSRISRESQEGVTLKHLTSLSGHTRDVSCIKFSGDGEWLITTSFDFSARVYSFSTDPPYAKIELRINFDDCVFGIGFHPSLPIISINGRSDKMQLWRLPSGTSPASCVAKWKAHHSWITCCRFDSNGEIILTGSTDRTIKVWRMQQKPDGKIDVLCIATLNAHEDTVNSITIHPTNPSIFVSTSMDCKVRFWRLSPDFSFATCILELDGDENFMNCAKFDPNGLGLVTGSRDSYMRLWH
jgi:WD40 repeat protein